MNNKLFVLAFLLLFTNTQAQTPEPKKSVVHLGIWYPLSTNGKEAGEYTNTFSFHLLYGISKSEKAFIFSGLGSSISDDATGLQFAGLGNIIGGKATGLTFAGLGNITGEAKGLQFAGLANISQELKGLQFAGLFNISQDLTGLQFAGLTNISQDVTGLQLAGLANIAQEVSGLQFGGLLNISGNMTGLQFAGLMNLSDGIKGLQFAGLTNIGETGKGIQFAGLGNILDNMHGFQFAGLGNISDDFRGFQIGGLGNISRNVNGFQFGGLFNKAENVHGVQFAGLLNIADHSDYPVGLINLIKDGEKSIGATFDELQNAIVAFRSGGRILYGILGVGYGFKSSENLMAFEGGFGAHINIVNRFRINTELVSTIMTQFNSLELNRNSLRVLPAFKITPHLEVFAGPSLNFLQTNDVELYDMFPNGSLWNEKTSSGNYSQLNMGYVFGLQYCF